MPESFGRIKSVGVQNLLTIACSLVFNNDTMAYTMDTRRLREEHWLPVQPTRINIKRAPEPRDEQPRIPGSGQRKSHSPRNFSSGHGGSTLTMPWSQKPTIGCYESPRDPEVVDTGGPNTWPRRGPFSQRSHARRAPSPSATSQYSVNQSEKSYGILDYYLGEDPPLPSPPMLRDTPRIETPVIDPAMEKFNFELIPRSPSACPGRNEPPLSDQSSQDTKSGAEQPLGHLLDSSPPPHLATSQSEQAQTYSLFPRVKIVTPPRKSPSDHVPPQLLHSETPTGTIALVPSHQQPDASYRPRRESMSSSVQSRKDSFNSFSGTQRIPMRVIASTSTPKAKARSTASNSTSTASPQQSRWSDDTVTSPGVLTTPGPRASFGSLLDRDNTQYPGCFFEDDDDDDLGGEVAPLRKKFRWQRWSNLRHEARARKPGRFSGRKNFGGRVARVLLCGCCGGQ